jgi:transposase
LVDGCGFAGGYQSVKRFIRQLRDKSSPEACAVIETEPGEDYGQSRVMVRSGAVSIL